MGRVVKGFGARGLDVCPSVAVKQWFEPRYAKMLLVLCVKTGTSVMRYKIIYHHAWSLHIRRAFDGLERQADTTKRGTIALRFTGCRTLEDRSKSYGPAPEQKPHH